MFGYKNRNTFLQRLHPLASTLLILTYVILFLSVKNPIYIGIIFTGVLFLSWTDGSLKELIKFGAICIPAGIIVALLNPIVVHNGNTVLYQGTLNIPVFGALRITEEAVFYGIFSGLRIIGVAMVMVFGNIVIHPDRAFSYYSKFLKKSALLMSMTIRLFPSITRSLVNISDAEKLRGNRYQKGSIINNIKRNGNIVNILFMSSLEDSSDMAESMYSRGYGITWGRSTYFRESIKKADLVIAASEVLVLTYYIYFAYRGLNVQEFYPSADNPLRKLSAEGNVLCVLTYIPCAANWWWNTWKKS